ncbi:metalloregulator ArsR/SmtB family transcription factor [Alteromonas sp. ASW11-36]|uniref:Metalloregulator ArsR/SmtB family transcription factor n=1 Tax=Alteromonas arenosi TaxID=3055817 RepID=A0ABT7ST35_9ALTE|nr:metalloregulator ArsR/SmtB family transcription factor [Alteromonas sp. ASW11-36]MDM7859310.1 metalloregulator ArsR/SmtB family transcription factor [Alteromonas sp. ASW11-36]
MQDFAKMEANAQEAINLLKALGNRYRLMTLCVLQDGEMSVSQLNEVIPIPQSSLSQHLAWLRKEKYVATRREAQTIYYSLNSHEVTEVIAVLYKLFCEDK